MEKEISILMADLTGYTAMTDVHGGASAARIVNKYMEIVNGACSGTTKVMQRVGDQVVMIADNTVDLIATVNQINALTLEQNHFLSIHAGMHFGSVFIENENLFGSTINVASRIMNIACRGQILCSASFFSKVPATHQPQFRPIGSHRFKNVLDEVDLFELLPLSNASLLHVDPVCHMHIDPAKALSSFVYNRSTYHFCSEHCSQLFHSSPVKFLLGQQ